MKRNMTIVMTVIVCFVLQTTFFQRNSFGGISPNLLIVLTAALGFMYGQTCGLLVGFFSGFLLDLYYGDVQGVYTLIYMYIGFINGFFQQIFHKEDVKLPIALIMGSNFVYSLSCYVLLFLLRAQFDFIFYFMNIILPEMVYTILVTVVLYPLILFANRKFITQSDPLK